MKKMVFTLAISTVIIALFILTGCQDNEKKETDSDIKSDSTSAKIIDFTYMPAKITIPKDGKITWVNKDSAVHTVTEDAEDFDSGDIDEGQKFSKKFSEIGTIKYFCTIHPYMKGTIVVK